MAATEINLNSLPMSDVNGVLADPNTYVYSQVEFASTEEAMILTFGKDRKVKKIPLWVWGQKFVRSTEWGDVDVDGDGVPIAYHPRYEEINKLSIRYTVHKDSKWVIEEIRPLL